MYRHKILPWKRYHIHLSDYAAGRLLGCQRCLPWLVNVFVGVFAQLWQIFADVLAVGVSLLTKRHGTVYPKSYKIS